MVCLKELFCKMDIRFKTPTRWVICGISGAGKTYFTIKLIEQNFYLFDKPFQRIVWVYGKSKPVVKYEQYDVNEINLENLLNSFNPRETNVLILDDVMHMATNDLIISDLFTKRSRHDNITVFFLIQNLFPKSKYLRDISGNTNYIVLLKNPRETLQIRTLAYQIYGKGNRFLLDAYDDATSNTSNCHSYLLLDFNLETSDNLRVRTNVFLDEKPKFVYVKKNKLFLK